MAKGEAQGKIKIITDGAFSPKGEQDALHFSRYSDRLTEIIVNSEPRFAIGIFGGWGTGKTSLMSMIKEKLEDKYKKDTLTVWFDAWKYDRDKLCSYAVLRQLSIKLESRKSESEGKWDTIRKGVERTMASLADSATFAAGYNPYASVQFNLRNFKNSLKASGSTQINGKTVQFHEHPTDHLASAIKGLRRKTGYEKIRSPYSLHSDKKKQVE